MRTILETGEVSDVTFHVNGTKFKAPKVILSARTSAFDSMFSTNLLPGQHERIFIPNMDAQVFKAMLYFLYTDTLPDYERSLVRGYAFGPSLSSSFGARLLAAADQYGLERLKSICESHLWRSITLNRFAETLVLADGYNASKLKNLCLEFAACNYAALTELDTFAYLRSDYPSLIHEVDCFIQRKL